MEKNKTKTERHTHVHFVGIVEKLQCLRLWRERAEMGGERERKERETERFFHLQVVQGKDTQGVNQHRHTNTHARTHTHTHTYTHTYIHTHAYTHTYTHTHTHTHTEV